MSSSLPALPDTPATPTTPVASTPVASTPLERTINMDHIQSIINASELVQLANKLKPACSRVLFSPPPRAQHVDVDTQVKHMILERYEVTQNQDDFLVYKDVKQLLDYRNIQMSNVKLSEILLELHNNDTQFGKKAKKVQRRKETVYTGFRSKSLKRVRVEDQIKVVKDGDNADTTDATDATDTTDADDSKDEDDDDVVLLPTPKKQFKPSQVVSAASVIASRLLEYEEIQDGVKHLDDLKLSLFSEVIQNCIVFELKKLFE